MTPLPRTTAERTAFRNQLILDALERARQKADAAYRSLKCQAGHHADRDGGCANNGSGCICDCHDPAPTARTASAPAPAMPVTFSDRSPR